MATSAEDRESGQVGQEWGEGVCNKEIDFARVGKYVLF